ncbi:GNAT family N-acetyltransferase [Leifsonia sp. LS-T14]|uniref:GNAT family N-acetyltransferase n=1 Tax=unclassified Leifsonia TaxID=2663824 RepID=UPI0035A5E244
MNAFRIRPAIGEDARVLADMLVEAANWNPVLARNRMTVLQDHEVNRYVAGWQRPSDFGCVAEDSHGVPVGASWARLFPANAPGHGFVAVGVPELTLAVYPQWRALGAGRALLRELAAAAASRGHARLSLSVQHGNFAQRLYVSEAYVTVASREGADTMVRTVR